MAVPSGARSWPLAASTLPVSSGVGVAAVELGDEPAGLAHQQNARGDVPARQAVFPESVIAAGRDIGEIERGRAEAPDAGDLLHHRLERVEITRMACDGP